jgi:hypothetical protein
VLVYLNCSIKDITAGWTKFFTIRSGNNPKNIIIQDKTAIANIMLGGTSLTSLNWDNFGPKKALLKTLINEAKVKILTTIAMMESKGLNLYTDS